MNWSAFFLTIPRSAAVLILVAIGRYEIAVGNTAFVITPFSKRELRIKIAERLKNP
jgi:hypothetical protein